MVHDRVVAVRIGHEVLRRGERAYTLLYCEHMPTNSHLFDDNPSLDGPDYVALVIEWDELADGLERQLRAAPTSVAPAPPTVSWQRVLGIAAGTIGALALVWRVAHRSRA